MACEVLVTKAGENTTWNEAVARALKGIGHPARVKEIGTYLSEYVIEEYPKTAKTPLYTIYRVLYTHSRDSVAGRGKEHLYFRMEKGVWGLENPNLWRNHRSDKKCDPMARCILEKAKAPEKDELQACCDYLIRKEKEWELLFGEILLLDMLRIRDSTTPGYYKSNWACVSYLRPLLDLYIWEITDEQVQKMLRDAKAGFSVLAFAPPLVKRARSSEYNIRRPEADYGINTSHAVARKEGTAREFIASILFPEHYTLPAGAQLKTVFKYFIWLHRGEYKESYILHGLYPVYKCLAPFHEKPYRLLRPDDVTACMSGLCDIQKNRMITLYHHLDNLAYEKDLISKRHSQGMQRVRIQKSGNLNEFSQNEIDTLIPHLGEIEVDMTLVLLYTGLRSQEICTLTFDDVDGDYIHIPNDRTMLYGRDIPIHPVIRLSLRHVLLFLQDRDTQNVNEYRKTRGVFKMVCKATEKYCGRQHTAKQCRSSFEIRIREAGASEGIIQYLLGVVAHSMERHHQVYLHPSAEKVFRLVTNMK